MENFSANHFVPLIPKLKQNLNLLKRCIVASEELGNCKKVKTPEVLPLHGKIFIII